MKFCLMHQPTSPSAQSPVRVVEQSTGREVGWINRYLDREYVRRLANTSLRIYACNLLHFVRWWESVHHTGDIRNGDLAESTLLDYVRYQSSQQPRPSPSTINDRVAVADRAIRNEFPEAPCQIPTAFIKHSAAKADGSGPAVDGHEPATRESTETQRCAALGK